MIEMLLILIAIGIVVYFINEMVPMAPPFKGLFNAVVCLLVVIWLLRGFGLIHMRF